MTDPNAQPDPPPSRLARLGLSEHILRAVRNLGWLTANHLILLVVSAVVAFWLARYLGPEKLGRLNYAISFAVLIGAFTWLGLRDLLPRELIRRPDDRHTILGAALAARLIAAVLAVGLAIAAAFLLRPNDPAMRWLIAIVALGLIPQAFAVIESWFDSRTESRYAVIARLIALSLATAARIAAILLDASLPVFAIIFTASFFIEAVAYIAIYHYTGERLSAWRSRAPETRRLLADAWPFLFANIAVIVYMRIDQVMIGSIRGDDAVGIYVAAVTLAELLNFFPLAIQQSVLPGIVQLREHNTALYDRRLVQLQALMTWLGLVAAISIALAAPLLIALAYGPQYRDAAPVLAILAFSLLFVFQGVAQTPWIIAENRQLPRSVGMLAAAALNVALNAVWIPRFGIHGAAWATLITYGLSVYLPPLLFPSLRPAARQLLRAWLYPLTWLRSRGRDNNDTSGPAE